MNNSEENTNEIIDDIEIVDVSEDTDTATNEAAKEDEAASSIENDTNNNTDNDIEILLNEDVTVDKDNHTLEPDNRKFHFTKGDKIRYVILALAVIIFIISAVKLVSTFQRYKNERERNDQIKDDVVDIEDTTTTAAEDKDGQHHENINPHLNIDFDELKAINSDTVAWVDIPSLGITYPVVQHTDNDYYLEHDITHSASWSGAIYLGYEHNSNFEDDRSLIYGHRMDDGSMFANLLKYDDEDFFKTQAEKHNNYVYIYMEDRVNVYEIFSITDVYYDEHPNAFRISFPSGYTKQDFLDYLKEIELYDTGVKAFADDKLLTLYTCQGNAKSKLRHMVHTRLITTINK